MRRLLNRSNVRSTRRNLVHEAPLELNVERGMVELLKRQQLKKILRLVLWTMVFCLPCLWWIELFVSTKPHTLETVVFPLHASFDFFNNLAYNKSHEYSTGLRILSWNDVTQPESYYRGVRPLYNIAFFAEVCIHDKTYFMLIDTGSEVSWLFCEPPFIISKDNPKLAGPHGLYQPSLDNMILYKDLHPSGFHACYQDQYLCRNICYLGGLVVKVLMVKETFVMQQIDMSKTSTKLVFGCGHSSTGPIDDIKNGVDGILGLMPAVFSFPHQLAMTGAIHKVIGLCLERCFHHPSQQVVGYLSLGDEVISVPEHMTWIQMVDGATTFGFAVAFLKTIQIGTFVYQFGLEGQSQQNAKIVFDSGTTMTYLMPDVYNGLIQHMWPDVLTTICSAEWNIGRLENLVTTTWFDSQLDKHAAYMGYKPLHGDIFGDNGGTVKRLMENYKMCWYRDLSDMSIMWYNDFENVMFTFQDIVGGNGIAKFQIEPSQYFNIYRGADVDSKTAIICPLFLKREVVNLQSFSILGGMAFQGHLIIFDIDNKKIGWSTEEDCKLLTLQKKILKTRTSQ